MPNPNLTLSIRKSEAKKQLVSQIKKGEDIVSKTMLAFGHHIADVRRDYLRFTKTTITMLSHMFDNPTISGRFVRFDVSYPAQEQYSYFGEYHFYEKLATEQVNELKVILESLKFVPEMPQTVTPAPSTIIPSPPTLITEQPIQTPIKTQSMQTDDQRGSKSLKQQIENHPIFIIAGTVVATATIIISIMIGLQSTRIENEKSRYEAIIENQKKGYESELRELRTKVKELESKTSGKDSNPSPSDK